MTLLVHGATVVRSLVPAIVERADILIDGGRVASVGQRMPVGAPLRDVPVLDATGCVVVPGNVNAHTHAYSSLARGMPNSLEPPRNFLEILQRIWWRLDRALDAEIIRASSLVAAREALLAGTTTLFDHHASPNSIGGALDIIAAAFADVGIRSVLAYEVSDRDGPQRAQAGIEENRRFLDQVASGDLPQTRAMVGAHASFTLSDTTLGDCAALARGARAGLHIHVAEDDIDEVDAVQRTGKRVVERLCDARAINGRALLAHAVHLDRFGSNLVRDSGATMVHNARSNMNNGVGRAPLDWLGDRVALGTDGIGSDMWAEGGAAYFHRREERLETSPDWALARLNVGAELAGQSFGEPLLGHLEPGAPADLVVLDYAAPTPIDATTLAGHWIFGLSAVHVRDVVVAGELVVRDRRLTRVDEAALTAHANEQTARLWSRVEELAAHPFSPMHQPSMSGSR